jgi:nitrous oxide reductase accessory protein NosL
MKSIKWLYVLIGGLLFSACQPKELKKEDEITDVQVIDYECHNCGMPADSPEWNVGVKTKGGEEVYYCSPRCFFTVYLDEKNRPQGILSMDVRDFGDKQKMPAEQAFFVTGTEIKGPMGYDLIPHKTKEAAEAFKKDKKGHQLLTFKEVTKEILKEALQKPTK